MVVRTVFNNREEWLVYRMSGIGASEIASVLGIGFSTPIELWQEKRGIKAHADLSGNERVAFGNAAEEPLRAMFRLMHPEYELTFTPHTVLRQEGEYSFLFDTPDGELTEIESGKRGLYESKTATCIKKSEWDEWRDKVPQKYYCQICQGMYCGGFDFAVIWALLRNAEGDGELRYYRFDRADCEGDIEALKRPAKAFWVSVQNGTLPPMPMPVRY